MKRVVFINRFYAPDRTATAQLLTDLARRLAARGWEVVVIASRPPDAPVRETLDGVQVIRVRSTRVQGRTLLNKAIDLGTFWVGATFALLRAARARSTVVALTDPPLIGVLSFSVGALRGARVIQWVQDIYPEAAIRFGSGPLALLARALLGLRDAAWRRSDALVTLGPDMASAMRQRLGPSQPIHLLPNWAPAGIVPARGDRFRRERGLGTRFVVGYSGNIGRVHGIEAIPPLIAALSHRADIAFNFVGEGARLPVLTERLKSRGQQVVFSPAVSLDDLSESLAAADLHLVTLAPGAESIVHPSKFVGLLAAGRPILFIGSPDCEIARLIRSDNVGAAFSPAETAQAAAYIERLAATPDECETIRANARALGARLPDADAAAASWQSLLEATGRSGSLPSQAA